MLNIIETILAMMNKISVSGKENIVRMKACIEALEQMKAALMEAKDEQKKAPE